MCIYMYVLYIHMYYICIYIYILYTHICICIIHICIIYIYIYTYTYYNGYIRTIIIIVIIKSVLNEESLWRVAEATAYSVRLRKQANILQYSRMNIHSFLLSYFMQYSQLIAYGLRLYIYIYIYIYISGGRLPLRHGGAEVPARGRPWLLTIMYYY